MSKLLHKRLVPRKNKVRFKSILMLFCVFLLIFNGIGPFYSAAKVQAAGTFTINGTDSYGVFFNGTRTVIAQFDGNNPSTTPEATLVTNLTLSGMNGLAIRKTEDAFYLSGGDGNGGGALYRVAPDGTYKKVVNLLAFTESAAISTDDSKYYYRYNIGEVAYLAYYDFNTGQQKSMKITGSYGEDGVSVWGGDILFDGYGNAWLSRVQPNNDLVRIDPATGAITNGIKVVSTDGSEIPYGPRGLSFLPDGRALMVAGSVEDPQLYTLDEETAQATPLGPIQGVARAILDLASRITPPEAELETVKTAKNVAGKPNNEVGDTIEYTIQARNTKAVSMLKNLVITDAIPAGLTYEPGSLKVDGQAVTDAADQDKGQYASGMVTGKLGDVADTSWHTFTFKVKITEAVAGQTITNTGNVTANNVPPQQPNVDIRVDLAPKLETTKTAKNVAGKANNEVGDIIEYTLTAKNTVAGSVLKNLVINDTLPAGLAYEAGSLKVDGTTVTDAADQDKGQYASGTVTGKIGNITDTNAHTVVFRAKITAGQEGKIITNTGKVTGDNVPPVEPSVPIKVDPLPKLESTKTAKNVAGKANNEVGDTVEYTITAKNTVAGSALKNLVINDTLPAGLEYVPGSLKVDGQSVTDAQDQDKGQYVTGTVTGKFGDVTDTNNHTIVFQVKITKDGAGQTITNTGKVTGDNVPPVEPKVPITVNPLPKLESTKTAKNVADKPSNEVGDIIEYTITAKNTVAGSVLKNLVITDPLPAGLEYVPGTMKVDGTAVTDATDQDKGQYVSGTVTGKFGNVSDTQWHTVVFQAKIKEAQEGQTIINTGKVTGDNVPPEEPEVDIKVDPKGKIEIEKVDASDANIKLVNAVFQILDKDGKEVGKLTTDANGKAISDQLAYGTYTLKEVQAPNGYMLLRDPIEVKVGSSVQKITVENAKSEWNIPNTGGIGTTIFYSLGAVVMLIALFIFLRKRNINK